MYLNVVFISLAMFQQTVLTFHVEYHTSLDNSGYRVNIFLISP